MKALVRSPGTKSGTARNRVARTHGNRVPPYKGNRVPVPHQTYGPKPPKHDSSESERGRQHLVGSRSFAIHRARTAPDPAGSWTLEARSGQILSQCTALRSSALPVVTELAGVRVRGLGRSTAVVAARWTPTHVQGACRNPEQLAAHAPGPAVVGGTDRQYTRRTPHLRSLTGVCAEGRAGAVGGYVGTEFPYVFRTGLRPTTCAKGARNRRFSGVIGCGPSVRDWGLCSSICLSDDGGAGELSPSAAGFRWCCWSRAIAGPPGVRRPGEYPEARLQSDARPAPEGCLRLAPSLSKEPPHVVL